MKEFMGDKFLADCEMFADILLQYNKTHNISGVKNHQEVIENILDSIYPIKSLNIENIKTAVDVGSGAGFPGLVLAMYLPMIEFTLFEPILKKSAFLHLAKSRLKLKNVKVVSDRIEKSRYFPADLITSRAVSDTKMLIKLTKNFITPSSIMLLYKGSDVEYELSGIKNYDIIKNKKIKYLILKDLHDL